MKVKFIKKHFSGIQEGTEVVSSDENCKRWIDQGFAEEVVKKTRKKRKAKTKED